MKFLMSVMLLSYSCLAFGQEKDSVVITSQSDTLTSYDEYYENDTSLSVQLDSVTSYDKYYENDSAYASSTYTQSPVELTPTKKERDQFYSEKKFSKTEWKRIVGETNYTEDPTEEREIPRSVAWSPALLKILGYVAILLLIGAIIYYLAKNAMQREPALQKTAGDSLLYANPHIDEINEDDIERLLREALERGDFRAAIRLYYIRLLKSLHSSGYITWKKDKTNRDYATELSAVPFTRDFRKLMVAYEIIWYGERTPSAEEFKKLQGNFSELQNQAARHA